ncbi:hypothetical protein DWB85_05955 [Seongchinamella sediminis]|uniref:DUF7933 domain-containing protein n=2 Tax=Seongchinamella sediminis TaxID=2283635 RepID=A0A3L7E2I9_9GAMM|nr:hypothetical protein DWB85_05955 [Seongchinamella sediminis]
MQAEGSRNLYPAGYESLDGRTRAALRVDPDDQYFDAIPDTHFIYVYAEAGEYILLGSRNRIDADSSGRGDRDIRLYNPQNFGTPGVEIAWPNKEPDLDVAFSCESGLDPGGAGMPTGAGPHFFDDGIAANGIEGLIGPNGASSGGNARAAELAGPNSADNSVTVNDGWKPCAYRAPVNGIYGVWFEDWSGTDITSSTSVTNPDPSDPNIGDQVVSVWDVSVRATASDTTDINGRVFTYKWTGANNRFGTNERLYFTLYYATTDGYRYQQDFKGVSPANHVFYGNTSGFLDQGQPLYKDTLLDASGLPAGVIAQNPQFPIFLSDIDPAAANNAEVEKVLAALGIPLNPVLPAISNLLFEGTTAGAETTLGAGGTFSFSSANTISYQIVLSRDGVDFDPAKAENRTLTGLVATGSHRVTWDGKDNAGNDFPVGGPYDFRLTGRNGESHFPLIDVERNDFGGPVITRLNGPAAGRTIVYFDDRGYLTRGGDMVGTPGAPLPVGGGGGSIDAPDPFFSLLGIDSSDPAVSTVTTAFSPRYYRQWDRNTVPTPDHFGNNKALDTWTFQSTAPEQSALTIIPAATEVDLATGIAVPATAQPEETVFGEVLYQNAGTVDSGSGVVYSMTFANGCPAALTFSFPGNAAASGVCSAGTVTFSNLPAMLVGGQQFTVLFNYAAPPSGQVPVSSLISVDRLESLVANNRDSGLTGVSAAPVAPAISKSFAPDVIVSGAISTLTVTLHNDNPSPLTLTASLVDTLPAQVVVADSPGTAGSCPGTSLASPGGNTLTYTEGSTLPAASSCTITVNVTSEVAGSYLNTIPVGGLRTDGGNNPGPANAELRVVTSDGPQRIPSVPVLGLVLLALLLAGLAGARRWS